MAFIGPRSNRRGGEFVHNVTRFKITSLGRRHGGAFPVSASYEVLMRGKKVAIVSSGAAILISAWLPTLASVAVVGGGAALVGGCAGKSDTRTEARTEARTAERAEQRVDNRHD